ncbi:hypothetical protein NLU13_8151 [Sarocladium strictum]|uniref:Clr5 domain-containing protein n=1 Tax=Sarocladium strictum TaxID=5046 RepID=A0AA39L4Q0_SARSR|nr:hypothetical protein NLU13_8151 [Sarocladium strictum]
MSGARPTRHLRSPNGPSASDWDKYRERITQLYAHDGLSCAEVAKRMEDVDGFRASRKMYRIRFEAWGLEKKVTREHALRILAILARLPRCSGLPYGELATEERRVSRYLRRLSPESGNALLRDLHARLSDGATNWPGVRTPPRAPDAMQLPTECILLLRSYVQGTCEAEIWPRDAVMGFESTDFVPAACSPIMSASWILNEGTSGRQKAAGFLNTFLERVPILLQHPDPVVFMFMYTNILTFATKQPGTAWLLLREMLARSEALPWATSQHPFRLILRLLDMSGPEQIHVHARTILLAYVGLLEEALGGAYPIIQDMCHDVLNRLVSLDLIDSTAAADHLSRLKDTAVAQNHHRTSRFLGLQLILAQAYVKGGYLQRARSTLDSILSPEHASYRRENIRISVSMLRARASEKEGKMDEAVHHAATVLEEARKHFGPESDWGLNGLVFYRKILESAGRTEEAEEVAKERDMVMRRLEERTAKLGVEDGWK